MGMLVLLGYFPLFSIFYWSYLHLQNSVMHQRMQDETSNKNQSEDWISHNLVSIVIGSACFLMFGLFTYFINWFTPYGELKDEVKKKKL